MLAKHDVAETIVEQDNAVTSTSTSDKQLPKTSFYYGKTLST